MEIPYNWASYTKVSLRRWLVAHAVSVSEGLMHKTLARLGLTLKKSRSTLPSSSALTSPQRAD
jgi:hypothetical protein